MVRRDKVESGKRSMSMLRQRATAPAERELTEAVHRVHERYGTDLKSFFRDVLEKTKSNPEPESKTEPESDDNPPA
jgi:hypothetical protein